MKRQYRNFLILFICALLTVTLVACGEDANPNGTGNGTGSNQVPVGTAAGKTAAAQAADDLIAAIGEVTLDSESKIVAALQAVAALSENDKSDLENLSLLEQARNTYNSLVAQAGATALEAAINAIGEVTLESADVIASVRQQYLDAAEEVKVLVTNLSVLEAAEDALAGIRAAKAVELIDAIGKITIDSEAQIQAAEDYYKTLTEQEKQKVTNAAVLTDARQAFKDACLAEAKKMLKKMDKEEDIVRGITFYYHDRFPYSASAGYWYADERSFVLPYLGIDSNNNVWLRLVCNYTAYSWIFFEKIIFSVDGKNTTEYFSYYDVVRDNASGKIWEYVDMDVYASEIKLLQSIADSERTIIRFEGDNYYDDVTVKEKDKECLSFMLKLYDLLAKAGYKAI